MELNENMKIEEIIERLKLAIKNYNPWSEQVYGGDELYDEVCKIIKKYD